jgi:16S rRNA (uracil1498-N3)-methyltransferase
MARNRTSDDRSVNRSELTKERTGRALRVPLSPLPVEDRHVVLPEAAAHYVARVHRLGVGDRIVLFDPEAHSEADCEIISVERDVRCAVGPSRRSEAVAAAGLTLLQAIGKGDKPEQVIRAATALGVEHVVFVESRRAVVRVGDRGDARRQRWHAVAVEAARQCGRGDVPRMTGPLSFADALALITEPDACRVYLSPRASQGLAEVLAGFAHGAPLAVLIGPEGGLDDEEEALSIALGFVPGALGRFVLRTETATVAALGAIAAIGRARPR